MSVNVLIDEFLVNTYTNGNQSYPKIAILSDGNFVVTWHDLSNFADWSVKAKIIAADGSVITDEFLVHTYTQGHQFQQTITALANGGFTIAWVDTSGTQGDDDNGAIKAKVFAADGTVVEDEFLVNSSTESLQREPSITSLSDGGFVVTWYDNSGTLGDNSSTSIKAKLFAADGSVSTDEFLVNTYTDGGQYTPSITSLEHGGFAIAWTDSSGTLGDDSLSSIKVKVFSAEGAVIEDEFLVNTYSEDYQSTPSITGLENGGFVVTWMDQSGTLGDDSLWSVKAKVFAGDGTVVSDEFLVNTHADGAQIYPAITSLSDGGFVVTWHDQSGTLGDSSGYSVKAKVFASDGAVIEDEFLVNTFTGGSQAGAHVKGLADGSFVVTWTDGSGTLGDSSGNSVKAKVFTVGAETTGDTVREGTDTTAQLTEATWQVGTIEAEPIDGDGVTLDNTGGFVDKDWYAVTLDADRTYQFDAESLSLSTGIVFIRLYDNAGVEVGDATFAEGATPSFTFDTNGQAGAQTFYFAVSAGDANDLDFLTATGDFQVRFTDTGVLPPTNETPVAVANGQTAQPTTVLSLDGNTNPYGLFTWDDPDGLGDIVSFSITDQSVGGGFLVQRWDNVTLPEGTEITDIPIADIGDYGFVFGDAGDTDSIRFTVTDSAGNTSAAVVAQTTSVAPTERPSNELLEYFSRVVGYDNDLKAGDSLPFVEHVDGASGWTVSKEFEARWDEATGKNLFRAVALEKPGFDPVLVFRGTEGNIADWLENTSDSGVGAEECASALEKGEIKDWFDDIQKDGKAPVLTGHSQGGAQAQWFTSWATQSIDDDLGGLKTYEVGGLVTFNSPGVSFNFDGLDGLPSYGNVAHYISAGDIVSQVGENFVYGNVIYYDFDIETWFKPAVLNSAHTGHWFHNDLNDLNDHVLDSDGNPKFSLRVIQPIEDGLITTDLASPEFTHLGQPGTDTDFSGAHYIIRTVIAAAEGFLQTADPIPNHSVLNALDISLADVDRVFESRGGVEDAPGAEDARSTTLPAMLRWAELGIEIWEVIEPVASAAGDAAWEFIGEFIARNIVLLPESIGFAVFARDAVNTIKNIWEELEARGEATTLDNLKWLSLELLDIGEMIVESGLDFVGMSALTEIPEFISEVRDLFAPGDDVVVVEGDNPLSAPAIVLDVEGTDTTLSSDGSALFLLGGGEETVNLGHSDSAIFGLAEHLAGTVVNGFASGSSVFVFGSMIRSGIDALLSEGSAILDIDADRDGEFETKIKLNGNYDLDKFVFEITESGTYIRYTGSVGPEAADDAFSVKEDKTVTGNVLDDNGNGADSDPDGDALSVSLVSGPEEGVLTLNEDGTFSYEADSDVFDLGTPGDVIDQSFTYQIDDGNGGVDQANATISVTILDDGVKVIGRKHDAHASDNWHGFGHHALVGADGGEDVIFGTNYRDEMYGLDGADHIFGRRGNDLIKGGESADVLKGGRGWDRLYGEEGADIIRGGGGHDHLYGGRGDDRLYGGGSDDVLNGGKGNDFLKGAKGRDMFIFAENFGQDTVCDFDVKKGEILDFKKVASSFDDFTIGLAADGIGTRITLDATGDYVDLLGVAQDEFDFWAHAILGTETLPDSGED